MLNRSRRVGLPWRSWYFAMPVVTDPRKTSLTVSPRFLAAARIWSNGRSNVANRYVVERPAISGDSEDSGTAAKRPIDSAIPTASDQVPTGSFTVPSAISPMTLRPVTAASAARVTLSAMFARLTLATDTGLPLGAGGASGSSGLPSAVSSKRLAAMVTVACPSATAWCSFSTSADRSPDRPSIRTHSHSGRSLSKSVRLIRRASARTSSQPPPRGSRNRCRWISRSKSGSIAKRGIEMPTAPNNGRSRRTGTSRVNRSNRARRRSQSGVESSSETATIDDRIPLSLVAVRHVAASNPVNCCPTARRSLALRTALFRSLTVPPRPSDASEEGPG